MAKKQSTAQKLINAAIKLVLSQDWSTLSMKDIATQAKVPLDEARRIFRDKEALIYDVMKRADNAALEASLEFQTDDTVKDKLFALLMARLDYLAPHRSAIGHILACYKINPFQVSCRLMHIMKSMKLMLDTAGVQTNSPLGVFKINGLALVTANTMRVWVKDDSDDLGPTMATLDSGLTKADYLLDRLFCAPHNNS